MKRRAFSIGAVSAMIAGTAMAEAPVPALGQPVQLWVPGLGPVRVSALYLGAGLGLNFAGGAHLHPEARADLSATGPFAGLFRTPFARRWADAEPLGDLHFVDGVLVAAGAGAGLSGHRVTLGAQDVSWDLPGRVAPMPGVAAAGPLVGTYAREAGGRILAFVPARAW